MPISRVRAFTEPIMVTNTTSASMAMMMPATMQLNWRNWSRACMRFFMTCLQGGDRVPGQHAGRAG